MPDFTDKIKSHFQKKYNLLVSDEDVIHLTKQVLTGHQAKLLEIETDLCEKQRKECITNVLEAMDDYHHPGMGTAELKKLISGVVEKRTAAPGGVVDTVRFLLVS